MKLLSNLAAVALIALLGTAPLLAQPTRIGTFDKRSVVVAFYRSPLWAGILKSKTAEMESARKANDTKKIEELKAWGGASQELAHRQLAGKAPITNILEALAPAFPEIAQKADVASIATDTPPVNAEVQTVDVTDLLLDWLKADEATRKIVRDLRNH
jgi:hypothetical protein